MARRLRGRAARFRFVSLRLVSIYLLEKTAFGLQLVIEHQQLLLLGINLNLELLLEFLHVFEGLLPLTQLFLTLRQVGRLKVYRGGDATRVSCTLIKRGIALRPQALDARNTLRIGPELILTRIPRHKLAILRQPGVI